MALQFTLFPNKGFSIGYAIHHAVPDGKTAALFMHSWASICRRGEDSTLMPELTPFYDRTFINDPTGLEITQLNGWLEQNGPNNRSLMLWDSKHPPDTLLGTFQLTQANIENIKKWVHAQWKEKHIQKPAIHGSTFTITCAYLWVCLVKAQKITTGKVYFELSVNRRTRLEPPLPSTYFGTCISVPLIDIDSNELIGEDGLARAAQVIREAIGGVNDEFLKGLQMLELFSLERDRLFSVAGSPHFDLNNTDFGWGIPRNVEIASIAKTGAFSLSDSRYDNGGVESGLVLKKHEIEAFASLC